MSQTAERTRLDEFAHGVPSQMQGTADNLPTVIEPHALGVLSRSEIDAQLAKADAHPRNLKAFRQGVRDLAMLNVEVAEECTYVIPRDGKEIPGPSIRFAEIIAYNFTNYRTGARIIEEAFDHVTAQGFFLDMQNNGVTTFELSRRITGKNGRRYSADMINTTKNAACQLAKRNAILQAVPRPLWHDIWEETRRFASGAGTSGKSVADRANAAVDAFMKAGVDEGSVLSAVGVTARSSIGLDELTRLRGFWTAWNDGEMSLDEIFRPSPKQTSSGLDQFASAGKAEPDAPAVGGEAPPADDTAGFAAGATKSPAADLKLYRMAIDKILGAALDKKVDIEDRVANLDGPVKEIWMNQPVDTGFVLKALTLGIEVARGTTKDNVARAKLDELVKELVPA